MNIKANGISTSNHIIIINTTSIAIAKKIIFLLFMRGKAFLPNNDDPHLRQTILPPKDLSETKEELPHLRQNLFEVIIKRKNTLSHTNYIHLVLYVKKNK